MSILILEQQILLALAVEILGPLRDLEFHSNHSRLGGVQVVVTLVHPQAVLDLLHDGAVNLGVFI